MTDAMQAWAANHRPDGWDTIPHCDQRILHAPGECQWCDEHSDAQWLRIEWGIAFTGHQPGAREVACPADASRPQGTESDHRRWYGNVATTQNPVNETVASRVMYPRVPRRLAWYHRLRDFIRLEPPL